MADPKTVLEFVKKNGVKMLDLRFTDLPGLQHHVSYPIDQLSEASFDEGSHALSNHAEYSSPSGETRHQRNPRGAASPGSPVNSVA